MHENARFGSWLLWSLVCVLIVSQAVGAQTQATGTIEGLVRDERGAVIAGAKVSARHVGTNAVREAMTDTSGRYRIVFLPPGSYEVTAEMPGFATTTQSGITVLVGGTATVDLTLKVAPVAETVTVTAEAPIVEPERTEFTSVVNESAVHNLPINGRRWENFVLLTPGVNPDGTFGLVSYRGISGLYNNNTVDGADNNQAFFSEARGRTRVVYTTSLSSIKEFQVGLSNFSAEFGRAAGGTVNAVTKSGTNEFHGEAFYFLRDDAIMAREPFQPLEPEERRQQFGFSLGGPFIKDKLFYFGTYDQQVRNFPYFVTPSSPTFLTSPCTAPGCAATIQFFQSLMRFVPRKAHNNVAFYKVDWVISPRHTFTGQYNWHRWRSPNGIRTAPIQFAAESDNGFDGVKTDFLLFRLSSALSNTLAHEVRFQYGRDFEFQRPNAPGPSTTVTGGVSFGMPNFLPRPAFPDEKRFQWVDNISLIRGRHNLKAGLDINYVRDLQINLFQGGGVYSYDGLNQIAKDCPKGAVGCTPLDDGPRTRRHYRSYVQAFDLRGLTGEQAGRLQAGQAAGVSSRLFGPVQVGGVELDVVWDTGAPHALSVPESVGRQLGLMDADRPYAPVPSTGIHGLASRPARLLAAPRLQVEEEQFEGVRAIVRMDDDTAGATILGFPILRCLDLALADEGRFFGVRRNNLQPVNLGYSLAGVWIDEARGGVRVSEVGTGSPGAEAGLRPGDVITNLGGFSSALTALRGPEGSCVPVTVSRHGRTESVELRLRDYLAG